MRKVHRITIIVAALSLPGVLRRHCHHGRVGCYRCCCRARGHDLVPVLHQCLERSYSI